MLQLVGDLLGLAARDVGELGLAREDGHDLTDRLAENAAEGHGHVLALARRHLVRRHEDRVNGDVDRQGESVTVVDLAAGGGQHDLCAVLADRVGGKRLVLDDLPVEEPAPDHRSQQERHQQQGKDARFVERLAPANPGRLSRPGSHVASGEVHYRPFASASWPPKARSRLARLRCQSGLESGAAGGGASRFKSTGR